MDKSVYIQNGVKKIYNNDIDNVIYVCEFDIDVRNRDGYCIDSRNIDSFFYGYRDNDRYRIVSLNENSISDRYISLDELNRGYISLDEFINEGRFIGREFRRLSSVVTYYGVDLDCSRMIDNKYLNIDEYDNKYIVLYELDNTFLVRYMYGNREWYGIVDCRYIQDGNYVFDGDVYLEYMDREKVYLDIVEQIDKYCNIDVKKKFMIR